jgi:hypothetical protein
MATLKFTGGIKFVFGIANAMPTKGFPEGKIRFRLRNNDFAKARVKTSDGIMEFYIEEKDGYWIPSFETARNKTV